MLKCATGVLAAAMLDDAAGIGLAALALLLPLALALSSCEAARRALGF